MDSQTLMIFLSILIFGTYSITQDIKERKISNMLNLFLFFISSTFFITSIFKITIFDFIFIFGFIFLTYYMYKKDFWGAADGKVFISLILMISVVSGFNGIVYYVTNLIIFYSIGSIVLSLIRTSLKDKKKVLLGLNYKLHIFIVSSIFIISSLVLTKLPHSFNPMISVTIMLMTFIVLFFIISKLKKWFNKFENHKKNYLNIFLFLILIITSDINFLKYFFPILLLKISIDYVSSITKYIKHKKKDIYYSPFSIYLFLVALFTLLLNNAVVVIIVEFIFGRI